jgi:zinc protease
MKNGLVLLIVSQPSLPIVNVQVMIKAGALYDPEDRAGLANLVSNLLDEGTQTRSSTEISEAIEFVGGSLSTGGGGDWATASLRILKKDLPLGLDLLSDILLHPTFPDSELERKRRQILGGLIAEKDEPGVVAGKAFNEIIFGQHPYHRPTEGTEESLPKITRDDLSKFYDQFYRPNNTLMAVVGDIAESEAQEMIERYFGSWAPGPIPNTPIPSAPPLKKRVVKLIDKDLTQANIVLGHVGIDRKNPDYYAVVVMNYILGGGGFSSRLMTEIRDNQGLAYSIHSHFAAGAYPGSFTVSLQTKNETAQQAIDGITTEIRRIRENPVSPQELQEAKDFLIGSFPLRMDTTAKIANLLTQVEYFNLGLDYFELYPKLIAAITRADVQRVAQKYLDLNQIALVVVAKQSEAKIKENGATD